MEPPPLPADDPPTYSILQLTMFVPGAPGTGVLQETGSLLLAPVTADEVISMRLSITRARIILFALTPVEFCKVQFSVPARLPTRSLGMGLAENEMDATGVPSGGFPCTVVRCTGAIEKDAPVPSRPVGAEVLPARGKNQLGYRYLPPARLTVFVLSSGTRSISSANGSMPAFSGSEFVTNVKVDAVCVMCSRSR